MCRLLTVQNAARAVCFVACLLPVATAAQETAPVTASPAPPFGTLSTKPYEGLFAGTRPAPIEWSHGFSQEAVPPPQPQRTGLQALIRATGSDFKAFPTRKSTWVILGIGAASAALVLPFDDEITEEFSESNGRKYFAPGRTIGQFYFQAGTAITT
jgi:hypothetical protein